jgi:hypothetical protein
MPSGIAPEFDHQITKTIQDLSVAAEPRRAMDVADRPDPRSHPVQLSELVFQRREDREGSELGCLVTLFQRQVIADHSLNDNVAADERTMARYVGQAPMDLD